MYIKLRKVFVHTSLNHPVNNKIVIFAEFLDVGKLKPALEVLSDVLRSKKHRTWQKVHEPIIEQYLNLCVELRKSQAAKEGLYQYKIICQQVSFYVVNININNCVVIIL